MRTENAGISSELLVNLRRQLMVSRALRRQAHGRLSACVTGALRDGVDVRRIADSASLTPSHVRKLRASSLFDEDDPLLLVGEHLTGIKTAREHLERADMVFTRIERAQREAMIEALQDHKLGPREIAVLAGVSLCRLQAIYQRHRSTTAPEYG